jgi:hypothetical protein
MGCDNLYYKFYEELKDKHNITKEQFIQYNFIFCGIYKPPTETYINDDGNECKRYIKHLIPKEGERLFPTTNFEIHPTKFIDEKLFKLLSHRFTYTYNCICDKSIIKNCFIYSISQDILLNIGKCCNKRFNENDTKRFCEICSVHHRNIKNNFCNECRKKMYDKCKKCKKEKKLDKYKWCWVCSKGIDNNNNIYYNCSICLKPKTNENEQKYKKCFDCRNL